MDTRFESGFVRQGSGRSRAVGRRLLNLAAAGLCALASAAAWAVDLTDLQFTTLPGGRFEAKLVFDGAPPQPEAYTIEKPARIALDFPGVTSRLTEKKFNLGYDNASSAIVLEGQNRTRMVLNLIQLAPYQTRIEGNTLFVEVGDSGARDYLKPVTESEVVAAATRKPVAATDSAIKSIDFQRGDEGEGRLIVDLNDPTVSINVFVEGEKIKVRFKNVQLPENLQRSYDVTDFATPVRSFLAQSDTQGSTVAMRATGNYDYLAYQTDNRYVVSVKPLTPEEVEQRKKEFAYTGERLSLNFQDIEVRAVLQLIADFTELNLVASDTVQGKITLRLQNVPWDQALELVLKTKGLDKRQVGNVLMVAPAAEIAERERRELETQKQVQELAPLQTEHIKIRYANAKALYDMFLNNDIKDGPPTMLSSRGRMIVDERTNSLLVTETAQKLEDFRRIIKALDIPVRQVLIEARIVIANSDFDEALGIRWGIGAVDNDGDHTVAISDSLAGALTDAELGQRSGSLNVDLGPSRPPFGTFAIGYAGTNALLGLELAALEAQGRGEVVSQPKVITGDKQQATIKSGTEIPYQESAANGETTISFKEAVLKLDVTPSITPDDRIVLNLIINQDSVGDEVSTGLGGFVPTIDTTELKTQVLVNNGETIVLGGVFKTEQIETTEKIPFLGDLPVVGGLFKNASTTQNKVETLIFITPRIMADTLID